MRLTTLVQQKYEQMSASDHMIWQYICCHQSECRKMSLHQLADACCVSHTSVSRFLQLLGMEGFHEFKVFLKWEEQNQPVVDSHSVEKMCYDLNRTVTMAENMDCRELFLRLDEAENVYAYGSGSVQKNAALVLKNYLILEGKLVHVIEGREERSMSLQKMQSKDMAFLFSTSGNNRQVIEYAEELKQKGVYLVSVCQHGANELARFCDFCLPFYTQRLDVGSQGSVYYSASGMFVIAEILSLRYAAHQAAAGCA